MSSEEYNPFFDESAESRTRVETNPFEDDDTGINTEFTIPNVDSPDGSEKPTILQVEDVKPSGMQTYTSLGDQTQQVVTMMRSVSMDEVDTRSPPPGSDQDLYVRVDSPEKHTEGYVSYSVTTQVTREEFEEREYKVRRRYNDFLWLRKKLEETNPTHIIPPLPDKNSFSKHLTDKFDPDYLKIRQKALDKFMCRLVDHPVLSFNDHLKTFLTAKAWEMTSARKKQPGAASAVGGSVRNTAAQLLMKNRDPEFEEMMKYNTQFQGKMKTFVNLVDQVANDRFYLLEDYAEYGTAFRLWANSESKLSDTLSAVAKSLDMSIDNLKNILRIHEVRLSEPIREYISYCDAVKHFLDIKLLDETEKYWVTASVMLCIRKTQEQYGARMIV